MGGTSPLEDKCRGQWRGCPGLRPSGVDGEREWCRSLLSGEWVTSMKARPICFLAGGNWALRSPCLLCLCSVLWDALAGAKLSFPHIFFLVSGHFLRCRGYGCLMPFAFCLGYVHKKEILSYFSWVNSGRLGLVSTALHYLPLKDLTCKSRPSNGHPQ